MNFVCIVFELGDKMLTLSSMENLIVQCNLLYATLITLLRISGKYQERHFCISIKKNYGIFYANYEACD